MAEAMPPSSPVCFVSEAPPGAVIIDEPDLAALIDFHIGVTVVLLVEEETSAMVANDLNHLVNLLGTLLLQGEFAFFRHGNSLSGHARANEVSLGNRRALSRRSEVEKPVRSSG